MHGDFLQSMVNHIYGSHGCNKCAISKNTVRQIKPLQDIIDAANKVHNFRYLYDKLECNGTKSFGLIGCKNHGYFTQRIINHLSGRGCPDCGKIAENEKLLGKTLKTLGISYEKQYCVRITPSQIRPYRIDFYLPNYNMFIEYNGAQHYAPARFGGMPLDVAEARFEVQKKRDESVRQYCIDNSIRLLEIDGRKYVKNNLVVYIKEHLILLGVII